MLPLSSSHGCSKSDFLFLLNKIHFQSNEVYYKVSLRENFQQQSCNIVIPLSNGPWILARNVTLQPKIQPQGPIPYNRRARAVSLPQLSYLYQILVRRSQHAVRPILEQTAVLKILCKQHSTRRWHHLERAFVISHFVGGSDSPSFYIVQQCLVLYQHSIVNGVQAPFTIP